MPEPPGHPLDVTARCTFRVSAEPAVATYGAARGEADPEDPWDVLDLDSVRKQQMLLAKHDAPPLRRATVAWERSSLLNAATLATLATSSATESPPAPSHFSRILHAEGAEKHVLVCTADGWTPAAAITPAGCS